jgi:hypothetical protein
LQPPLAAAEIGVRQERTGCPFRWTVQAPHWPIPQPYLAALRSRMSRSTHSSGMSEGTSTVCEFPFTARAKGIVLPHFQFGWGFDICADTLTVKSRAQRIGETEIALVKASSPETRPGLHRTKILTQIRGALGIFKARHYCQR